MCLTSELEMGCMVPCSRMGEEKEEEEAQLAEEGIKEQVSLERKEESKLSFQVFPFFPPCSVLMQAPLKMLSAPARQHRSISV